jgi:hypothetical protein
MLSCGGTIIGIESSIQIEKTCRLLSIMTMALASGRVMWPYTVPRPKALAGAGRVATRISPEYGDDWGGRDGNKGTSVSPLSCFGGLSCKTSIETNDEQFDTSNCDEEHHLVYRAEM